MGFNYKKYKEAQFKSPFEESKVKKVKAAKKGLKNVGKQLLKKAGRYLIGGPVGATAWMFADILSSDVYEGKGRKLTPKEKFDRELEKSQTAGGQSKL